MLEATSVTAVAASRLCCDFAALLGVSNGNARLTYRDAMGKTMAESSTSPLSLKCEKIPLRPPPPPTLLDDAMSGSADAAAATVDVVVVGGVGELRLVVCLTVSP